MVGQIFATIHGFGNARAIDENRLRNRNTRTARRVPPPSTNLASHTRARCNSHEVCHGSTWQKHHTLLNMQHDATRRMDACASPPNNPGRGRYCKKVSLSMRVEPPLTWHKSRKVSLMTLISHSSTVGRSKEYKRFSYEHTRRSVSKYFSRSSHNRGNSF